MRGLTFLLLSACFGGALADGIENVRLRTEQDRARVVFDLEQAISYRAFTMSNPSRVVIDIEQINYPKALSLPAGVAAGANNFEVLERLRYAVRNENGLRIVLDLNEKVALKHTVLPPRQDYGHRLVLDLHRSKTAHKAALQKRRGSKPDETTPGPNKQKPAQQSPLEAEQRIVETDSQQATSGDGDKALAILNGSAPKTAVDVRQTSVPEGPAAPNQTAEPERIAKVQVPTHQVTSIEQSHFQPPRDVVIAIDAGHGGNDVGAIGPKGTYEKDIVLRISRELAAAISREPGMRAILTREKDEYVGLRERMNRARRRKAGRRHRRSGRGGHCDRRRRGSCPARASVCRGGFAGVCGQTDGDQPRRPAPVHPLAT